MIETVARNDAPKSLHHSHAEKNSRRIIARMCVGSSDFHLVLCGMLRGGFGRCNRGSRAV